MGHTRRLVCLLAVIALVTPALTLDAAAAQLAPSGRLCFGVRSGGPQTPRCGIALTVHGSTMDVFTSSAAGVGTTVAVALPDALNRVFLVEQRSGGVTQNVCALVNGALAATIPFGSGDVYAAGADAISSVQPALVTVDEYEFWPVELTLDPEALCEYCFDGTFDPADSTCLT